MDTPPWHLILPSMLVLGSGMIGLGALGERLLRRQARRRMVREAAQRRRDRKEPYGG